MKTYYIDIEVDSKLYCSDWRARNKADAIKQAIDYYTNRFNPVEPVKVTQVTMKP